MWRDVELHSLSKFINPWELVFLNFSFICNNNFNCIWFKVHQMTTWKVLLRHCCPYLPLEQAQASFYSDINGAEYCDCVLFGTWWAPSWNNMFIHVEAAVGWRGKNCLCQGSMSPRTRQQLVPMSLEKRNDNLWNDSLTDVKILKILSNYYKIPKLQLED